MQATNETRVRKSWKLSLGLATLVLLCLMTAAAQTTYTVTELGTLGGTFGVATNIANWTDLNTLIPSHSGYYLVWLLM